MTCYTMNASSTKCSVVHRDQHQIRKRLLNRLGFTSRGEAPSITRGTVRTTPKLSCRHPESCSDCSTSQASIATCSTSSTSSQEERHVRFAANVSVQEIPHHRDYEDETRRSVWMGRREIEKMAQRNRIEYLADGYDYRKVTEEKGMMRWNGELVHPATYWVLYEEEQQQLLQEELYYGMSVSPTTTSSSSPALGVDGTPIKKSPTVTSLVGMAA